MKCTRPVEEEEEAETGQPERAKMAPAWKDGGSDPQATVDPEVEEPVVGAAAQRFREQWIGAERQR